MTNLAEGTIPAANILLTHVIDDIYISYCCRANPVSGPKMFLKVLPLFISWIASPSLARQLRRSSFNKPQGSLRDPGRLCCPRWRLGRTCSNIQPGPLVGGRALIAAHGIGRICNGVELDPLHVDLIGRRFEEVTWLAASLLKTRETFAELRDRWALDVAITTIEEPGAAHA